MRWQSRKWNPAWPTSVKMGSSARHRDGQTEDIQIGPKHTRCRYPIPQAKVAGTDKREQPPLPEETCSYRTLGGSPGEGTGPWERPSLQSHCVPNILRYTHVQKCLQDTSRAGRQ